MPLLEWYWENKRTLPWRDQNNAYYTWVSEIMLQQTRVEAVKPYFLRFIDALPDIQALAECPEDRLLKLWEGLGYYNRVRNMQTAAREVMERHGGVLPASYEALLNLTGIGPYTASAIASIAYQIAVAAVDGNVLRVVTRWTENKKDIMKQSVRKEIEQQLAQVIPADHPGDFNQAMMELGAVICVPNGAPKCQECPVSAYCNACHHDTVSLFPVKAPKKKRTIEEKTILVIQDGEQTALRKRPDQGLLAGLYELPGLPGHVGRDEVLAYLKDLNLDPLYIEEIGAAKHIFSHIEWRMIGYRIRVASLEGAQAADLFFADRNKTVEELAIPSAFRFYAKYLGKENTGKRATP